MIYLFLIVNFLIFTSSFAESFNSTQLIEIPKILKIVDHQSINLTEIHLQNGLKVILKPTDFEPNEVYFRLCANGGYASLPEAQYVSGKLAASVAWESGVGEYSSDQISAFLYKHSIEFLPQILPFTRCIEGNLYREETEVLFKLVNWFFTKHRLTQEAFNAILHKEKENLEKKSPNNFKTFIEKSIYALNVPYLYNSKSLTVKDLEKADFAFAGKFFEEAFSDPAEFTLVIVGDFEAEKIKSQLNEWLGSIPVPENKNNHFFLEKPLSRSFPKGITSKSVKVEERNDSLIHLTFPLTLSVDEGKMGDLEVASRLIQNHLRNSLQSQLQSRCDIEACLVFPFHPSLESPWLTIKCRCDQKKVEFFKKTIFQELKSLQKNGCSKKEILEASDQLKKHDEFWMKENDFWLVTLSNYSLWKWDFQTLLKRFEKLEKNKIKSIQKIIQKKITLETYTVFSVNP